MDEADIEYFAGEFPSFSSLLKTYNIVPDLKVTDNVIEAILSIVGHISYLSLGKIVIVFDLFSLIDGKDVPYLIDYARSKDICLMDIERFDAFMPDNGNIRKLILDKDYCEILVNYE